VGQSTIAKCSTAKRCSSSASGGELVSIVHVRLTGIHGIRDWNRPEKVEKTVHYTALPLCLASLLSPMHRTKLSFWYGLTAERQFSRIAFQHLLWPSLMASEATQILQAISAGDRSHVDKLMQLVYDDLRRLARAQLGAIRRNTHSILRPSFTRSSSS
jgi:hypothetical protein